MGGAVSSGESNDELIDNLLTAEYIRSPLIATVFRAVDRGFYFTKQYRHNAYKDLAWKDGNLHISAPCIYSEVMENLKLKPGMSFLNIGSGTGYLSTVVGLVLGKTGINHGIEIHEDVVDYARAKLDAFFKCSAAVDMFDFCAPEFVVGNWFETLSTSQRYDRIYCGAACAKGEVQFILNLLKIGGVCIVPTDDSLVQITRCSELRVEAKTLLPVSFASLLPRKENSKLSVSLPAWNSPKLNELCRAEIRDILRQTIVPPRDLNQSSTHSSHAEENRKKRRKRRDDRRRAHRLFMVQRRRDIQTRATRNNGSLAIVYSVGEGDHSSSDGQDSVRCRSPCVHNNGSNNPSFEKDQVENDHESGSESGGPVLVQNSVLPKTEAEGETPAEIPLPSTSSPRRRPAQQQDVGTSRSVATGTIGESDRNPESPPPSRHPRLQAETMTILERIREIIHNRQLEREREAHLRQAELSQMDRNLADHLEAAFHPTVQEPEELGDEFDHECVWSSDDTTSSSSTSTTSSDDDSLHEDAGIDHVGDGDGQVDIAAIGDNLPGRRIRVMNLDSSDDEEMDVQSSPPPMNENGRSNIEIEIEALRVQHAQPILCLHPTSVGLMSKINKLDLPPAIKKFLNYERQL